MVLLLIPVLLLIQDTPDEPEPGAEPKWGHSRHGFAYDEGPRQRPWKMQGVGEVRFPITTSVPEVQAWFDQGMALLHGFWFYEAERAFRWCAKLDPDCAMAYWGLSRSGSDPERRAAFLQQASELKERITPRERRYIDLAEAVAALRDADGDEEEDELRDAAREMLERLLMDYPDDVEAKSLYVMVGRGLGQADDRFGSEAVLQDILDLDPDHVGALHYRIHNWDGEDGHYAIDSCLALAEAAPNCGHLQHMPGHVLSGIGMWHEAAIAMDAATRLEKEYMHKRCVLPVDNWNYLHNLDYLSYIQEQLGMYDAAVLGAEQLMLGPLAAGGPAAAAWGSYSFGADVMVRALVKAERWEEVLEAVSDDPHEEATPRRQVAHHAARTRAHLGLGDVQAAAASFEALQAALNASPPSPPTGDDPPPALQGWWRKQQEPLILGLEGLLSLQRGDALDGIQLLTQAAEAQEKTWRNDPPKDADYWFNALGEALFELGSPSLAAEALERTLDTIYHDGIALAGLVRCYHVMGEADLAAEAMAALEVAWSGADPGNRRLAAARATGVVPATGQLSERFRQAIEQRGYRDHVYDVLGPSLYTAPEAPELSALNAEGEEVSLADYVGRNVVVLFYLGEECLHCVEQIQLAEENFELFQDLDTDILAISKDSLEEITGYQPDYRLTLLTDEAFENARRFKSFDDFEGAELHSTFLIDARGRLHWSRIGGPPFMDFEFLQREAARLHKGGEVHRILNPQTVSRDDSSERPAGGQ